MTKRSGRLLRQVGRHGRPHYRVGGGLYIPGQSPNIATDGYGLKDADASDSVAILRRRVFHLKIPTALRLLTAFMAPGLFRHVRKIHMIMLIVAHPRLALHKLYSRAHLFAAGGVEERVAEFGREDHAVDLEPVCARRAVEGEQVGGDGVEVDAEFFALAGGVKFDGIAEFRPRPGGVVCGFAGVIEHRDHEVDGEAVLVGSVRAQAATAEAPGGLTVGEMGGGSVFGEDRIGGKEGVADAVGNAGAPDEGAKSGVGAEVGAAARQAFAVEELTGGGRADGLAGDVGFDRAQKVVAGVNNEDEQECEEHGRDLSALKGGAESGRY